MPPVARAVEQLDGSAHEGGNCVAASDAMLIDRSTGGKSRVTGGHVRAQTGDTVGGLTLDQVRYVDRVLYRLTDLQQDNSFAFAHLKDASQHRGYILLGDYAVWQHGPHDCFRHQFGGNHGIWVNHWDATRKRWYAADPGADGRYAGCPKGYQWYTDDELAEFAGRLRTSATTNERLGMGNAQVLFSQPDDAATDPVPVPPPTAPHVVLTAPTPSEVNAMIAPATGVTSTRKMLLAKDQPIYRNPGGKRVTKMSAQASVNYIGPAGAGWVAVVVGTGVPYKDHKTRPTVLYVPAKAGPVS